MYAGSKHVPRALPHCCTEDVALSVGRVCTLDLLPSAVYVDADELRSLAEAGYVHGALHAHACGGHGCGPSTMHNSCMRTLKSVSARDLTGLGKGCVTIDLTREHK